MSLSFFNWFAFGAHLSLGIFFSIYFPFINKSNPQSEEQKVEMQLQDHSLQLSIVNRRVQLSWISIKSASPTFNTVQGLLIAFFLVTALFHLIYATSPIYPEMIKRQNNWMRWIEYSITATAMLYILALICTVKDTNVYLLLGPCNVVMIGLGQLIEEKIRAGESPWLPMVAGFLLLISEFSIIVREYIRRIKDVNSFVSSIPNSKVGPVPYWITYMTILLFLFFSCFGFVALYQSIHPEVSYESIEKIYIILSLVSKAILGGFLAYGITWGQQKFN